MTEIETARYRIVRVPPRSVARRHGGVAAHALTGLILGGALGLASAAHGQAVSAAARAIPGTVEPGRSNLPSAPAPTAPDFELSIESLRHATLPDASDQVKFTVNGITLKGVTAFPADHFAPLYAGLLGHPVKLSELAAIADAIETEYRKAGYVLSRAYVPPQHVRDGIFEIAVVEGYVSDVSVIAGENSPALDPALEQLITHYFDKLLAERPAADPTIEHAMLLVTDLPGHAATGLLRPSADHPGASELVVTETAEPITGGVSFDNRGSKFAGPLLLNFDAELTPDFIAGDYLTGSFTTTPDSAGRLQASLNYAVPVGNSGAIVSFNASGSYGEPGDSLSPISLVTSSYAFGPHIRYPLLRSRNFSLYLDSGLNWKAADVVSLSKPVSHDEWRSFDASLTLTQNGWLGGSSSFVLSLTQGVPVFGATRNGAAILSRPGAATDFTKIGFTAQRLQPLVDAISLAVTLQGQYAFSPLLAGEQIAFGGDTVGRGYDPAALLGDAGFGGSVELRYDHQFEDSIVTSIEPYVFSDTGAVWDRHHVAPGNGRLASVGGGVRFTLPHQISGDVEVAKDVWSVSDNDNGRLSSRILFDLRIRL